MRYVLCIICVFFLASCNLFWEKNTSEVGEGETTVTETITETKLISDEKDTGDQIRNQTILPALEEITDEELRKKVEKIHINENLTVDEKVEKIQALLEKNVEKNSEERLEEKKGQETGTEQTEVKNDKIEEQEIDEITQDLNTQKTDKREEAIEPQLETLQEYAENIIKKNDVGQFCVLDTCVPVDVELMEKSDTLFQGIEKTGKETDYSTNTYTVDLEKQEIEIEKQTGFGGGTFDYIYKVKQFIGTTEATFACAGGSITQHIFTKTGTPVSSLGAELPDVYIGNIQYVPIITFDDTSVSSFIEGMYFQRDERFKNIVDFQDFIVDRMSSERGNLYQNYVVRFEKYPQMYVMYTAQNYDKQAEMTLVTDEELLVDDMGNLLSLEQTNAIIEPYLESTGKALFIKDPDEEWSSDRVAEALREENLPVLRVKKIPDFQIEGKSAYLLYTSEQYVIQSLAELCKPLVYYYSKQPETNILTLKKQNPDRFTKIIPDFTGTTSWDFVAHDGKVTVKNEIHNYLYYALEHVGYTPNKHGWIVKGSDVETFFTDKLTKMNFYKNEKQDFIDYWEDKYEDEKYYFISFKYKKELDEIIKLSFVKAPTNEFRVLLDSYELESLSESQKYFLYDVQQPHKFDLGIIQRFNRGNSAREVFEWGGVLQTSEKTYIK